MKKVDMIVDLQYGSTGKGLIAGYLAEKNGYDTVINANMPNAGHTYINAEGREWIHKVLPNGIVSPNLKRVMIGAGSVFSVDRLEKELADSADLLIGVQIMIHPMAVVLKDSHVKGEGDAQLTSKIGSTGQGSVMAMIHKMLRDPNEATVARDVLKAEALGRFVVSVQEWNHALRESKMILAEAAQGFSLGINQDFYPYCTSRECTPARFLSDMGIPHNWLNKVVGTARTYPIRVAGNSGSSYKDQEELSWEQLGQKAELTTVTKKVRRVFTFSKNQIEEAIFACQPDEIFLNFCNYCDANELSTIALTIEEASNEFGPEGCHIRYTGHGATFGDVEDRSDV